MQSGQVKQPYTCYDNEGGFEITAMRMVRLTKSQAESFIVYIREVIF